MDEVKPLDAAEELALREKLVAGELDEDKNLYDPELAAFYNRLLKTKCNTPLIERVLATLDAERKHDNPKTDCTEYAHPAWWRGHEHGFDGAVRVMTLALYEDPAGTLANEAGQNLRTEIVKLRHERDRERSRREAAEEYLSVVLGLVPARQRLADGRAELFEAWLKSIRAFPL